MGLYTSLPLEGEGTIGIGGQATLLAAASIATFSARYFVSLITASLSWSGCACPAKGNRMKRWPLAATFVLFIALCVSAAYWAMQWLKPPSRPVAAPPQAMQQPPR